MSDRNQDDFTSGPSLSLTGLLAFMIGGCLLFAWWRFPALAAGLSDYGRMLFLAASGILTLWGVLQMTGSLVSPAGKGMTVRTAVKRPQGISISWLGVLLTLLGLEMVTSLAGRVETGLPRFLVIAVGVVMMAWGVREIAARLLPWLQQTRPRYRRSLTRPGTVYFVIMFALALGSLLGRSNMLMLVFAMMAGPFVVNGWVTYSTLKRTRVERIAPATAMAGEPVTVEVALDNHKRALSTWLTGVSDRVENDQERLEAEVLFARIPPRGRRTAHYRLQLMQRGSYRFGPMQLTCRFPLGLVERGWTHDVRGEILIYPRVGRLTPAWKQRQGADDELVHRQETRRGVFDDEFHRIREYRAGDNPRAIHWRTSARQNELMVREFHQSRDQDLVVLLDLWVPGQPLEGDRERVELAVSLVATVCVDHIRRSRDAKLSVASAGDQVTRWDGECGTSNVESVLRMLALVQPGPAPDVPELVAGALSRRTANTRMVLVTTRACAGGRFAELDDALRRTANGNGKAEPGDLQVVEASPEGLAPLVVL